MNNLIQCSHSKKVDPNTLKPHPKNPNNHPDLQIDLLAKIIKHQGWRNPIVVSKRSGFVIAGHARLSASILLGSDLVPVDYQDFESESDELAHLLADNKLAELADPDESMLSDILRELTEDGVDTELAGFDANELTDLINTFDEVQNDAEPQIDNAEKLCKKWEVQSGQIWQLGKHLLMCGDSTNSKHLQRLMGKEKANLVHADPPYGMGKESDGVINDNLYKKELDAFQMKWWTTCRPFLNDNAGAYIWGNDEDLWRLWFCGGLSESETLSFRNEIVWDKGNSGMAVGSVTRKLQRSERCLFFMIGEQDSILNADQYWQGWEPIRKYLCSERDKAGLKNWQMNEACGKQNMTQPAFTKGGFRLILKEDYLKLRDLSGGKCFNKNYDELLKWYNELKEKFNSTRGFFDNTHENMTDVWSFLRVHGDERHNHATPKSLDMIVRAVKSACPIDGIVFEPFIGSGTTLMACENSKRLCRGIELQPKYCATTIERWAEATGGKPKLV